MHVDELRPWEKNPRKNDPAVPRVAESIKRFGFVSPIVVWQGGNRMVAGHTRLKAMRALMKESPDFVAKGAPAPGMVRVAFHEFADEHEADIYALADNRLGEAATGKDDLTPGGNVVTAHGAGGLASVLTSTPSAALAAVRAGGEAALRLHAADVVVPQFLAACEAS